MKVLKLKDNDAQMIECMDEFYILGGIEMFKVSLSNRTRLSQNKTNEKRD